MRRKEVEIERFRTVENVNALPDIFHTWSSKHVAPKLVDVFAVTGIYEVYARYIIQYAKENPGRTVEIFSIGAGNGDIEAQIAILLKTAGLSDFRFHCLDINPAMLARGRAAVAQHQLDSHFDFIETDISDWTTPLTDVVVLANHSLHHIQQLEHTFSAVKRAIARRGYFVVCDMIGRNGHMRWPEALEVVHDVWRKMPDRYKYNHQLKRFEELYENWDCSSDAFEGIRAQDILPLLVANFHFDAFIAYGNLPDIFIDRCFGHNFDPANPEDVAFIDRIGELNETLIDNGTIKPTQMMAAMRAVSATPTRYYRHWTPEFCVRQP